ncbi:DUF1735 domain-containing protein [Phocaeicola sp. KGMB11183]|uniref:DUF1735 domain-containing protein n=1 Tax=Phocaeicola acetigenes TaxID=3016083 RepID=A0ABT4PJ02_9BACT|nr:DUF1735 domain-containing protein [Phocaeicola sp. KGMB11183]MCZ8373018.1 DUF1735 domain-containing protein [Phocaeicola sp. KGMB11183]
MKKLFVSICAVALFCLAGCKAEYDPITENIYIADAENVNYKRLTIDNEGGSTSFSVRMSAPAQSQVKATLHSDPAVLEEYNKLNGTNYLPLPEHLYSLSEEEITIEPGKLSASPIKININPLDETVNDADKYAIPVSIAGVSGTSLLEASSHLVIVLDRVIVTNILKNAKFSKFELPSDTEAAKDMSKWTIEFLFRVDQLYRNQQLFWVDDRKNVNSVFVRLAEFDHPVDELQFKLNNTPCYGPTRYQANVWHHVAIVYDGVSYRIFKDGKLDLQIGAGTNAGLTCSWRYFEITAKSMSELRVWSCARTESEIANNMYAVNPDTEYLELYWKINEGEGSVIHDYAKYHHDMTATGTWVPGQRFPENME